MVSGLTSVHYIYQRISTDVFVFKGIIPESATTQVRELFVPEAEKERALAEATTLPSLEINTVNSKI